MNSKVKFYLKEYAVGLFMVLLVFVCMIGIPKFATVTNILNISTQIAINGLIATGMTFVILTGGIDLSVGSVAALASIFASDLSLKADDPGVGLTLAIFLGVTIVTGVAFGLFTGVFINRLNVPPFIASLVTMNIARGIAYLYTNSKPIHGMNMNFRILGLNKIGGILPVSVLILILVIVAAYLYLSKTRGGRFIFSVGSSEEVSKLCGINVNRTKYIAYVVCAALASLAGCVYASKLQAGQPNACDGYELNAIAAVAMGGTSMQGGKGGMIHTVFGIIIIGVINNALNLLGVNAHWQKIILGIIILIAVVSDTAKTTKDT